MPIRFGCVCGAQLEAPDGELAQWLTCSSCGREVTVPASPGDVVVAEAEAREAYLGPASSEEPLDDASLADVPSRDWRRRAEEVEQQHQELLKRFTVWRAFAGSLAFPIRGSAGWWTLLLPILAVIAGEFASLMWSDDPRVLVFGVLIGPTMVALASVLCLGWSSEIVRAATEGPTVPPEWAGKDLISERLIPGVRALGHFAAVVAVPSILLAAILNWLGLYSLEGRAALYVGPVTRTTAAVIVCVYYPMSVSASMAFHRLLPGLNPLVVVRAILKVPLEYGLTVLFAFALGALCVLAAHLASGVLGENVYLLWPWFAYYSLCAVLTRLGFLVHRNRSRMGWGHRLETRPTDFTGTEGPLLERSPYDATGAVAPETDQWLRFTCRCGRKVATPFSAMGRRMKCPACGRRMNIPGTPAEEGPSDNATGQTSGDAPIVLPGGVRAYNGGDEGSEA